MAVGAIVLLQSETKGSFSGASRLQAGTQPGTESLHIDPLPLMQVFGKSTLERTLDRIAACGVQDTTVLVDEDLWPYVAKLRSSFSGLHFDVADDVWFQVGRTLRKFRDFGIEHALIVDGYSYMEADFAALLEFHRQQSHMVTRVHDAMLPLDLWVADCDAFLESDELAHRPFSGKGNTFVMKGYTKRIATTKDFRQLIVDAFLGRCQMHPSGREIRPGVWIEEDAQISRGARVVAPAYVGHGVTINENALITRCSNVEQCSQVDCFTALEDTTILPHTYVGISLDVRHSIVQGNKLLNFERGVVIQSDDVSLFRSTLPEEVQPKSPFDLVRIARTQETSHSEEAQVQECYAKSVPSINPATEFES